jgi:hypothetical protein
MIARLLASALLVTGSTSAAPAFDDTAWLRANATLIFHDAFDREETGNGSKAILSATFQPPQHLGRR